MSEPHECPACGVMFTRKPGHPETRSCSRSCAMRVRRQPSWDERFWRHVTPDNECWPWSPAHPTTGYGRIKWKDGRQHSAHRIAYELEYGWMSDSAVMCHECDNPACCNPKHLWLGTYADNNHDRDRKGRTSQGERHYAAKLTAEQVRDIRDSGESHSALSRIYGVAISHIANIRKRTKWRSVA